MTKKDNTIWWVLGVIAVLVVGGFVVFNTEKSKCQREGGIYVEGEGSFVSYCNKPTTDAGVRCDDLNQCQGYCEYDPIQCVKAPCLQGRCSSMTQLRGCVDVMIQGNKDTLCVD